MADLPTLADAKVWLHVDDTSEDATIQRLLDSAAARVEAFTGHLLTEQAVDQVFETFGVALELNRQPVSEVSTIAYADANGDAQELDDYLAALTRTPPRIYPARDSWWPSLDQFGVVTVTYTAGYADGAVPEALAEAVLRLVAHWFESREAGANGLPADVVDLCGRFRKALA